MSENVTAFTIEGGEPTWIRDTDANDSDKSFTVPSGAKWIPYAIWIDFTATATAGARSIYCRLTDGTNVVWQGPERLLSITAGQTGGAHITFGPLGLIRTVSYPTRNGTGGTYDTMSSTEYPAMTLLAGYEIHILDTSAVDAAADDMIITLYYREVNV